MQLAIHYLDANDFLFSVDTTELYFAAVTFFLKENHTDDKYFHIMNRHNY